MPLGLPHSQFLSWSLEDQDKALAYNRHLRSACSGCGTRQSEWDHNPNAYLGDLYHCEGCARLEEERNNAPENSAGLHIRLLPEAAARARLERGEGVS